MTRRLPYDVLTKEQLRALSHDHAKVAKWARHSREFRKPKPQHFADNMTSVEYWRDVERLGLRDAIYYHNRTPR